MASSARRSLFTSYWVALEAVDMGILLLDLKLELLNTAAGLNELF
jgi:hypothetical protein